MLIVGGFGMTGNPVHLLHALAETPTRELTYVGNNVGEPGLGGGRLLRNGQIKKVIGSYFTSNTEVVQAAQSDEIEVELLPQGTLAEAIRAGGAGIGGFFTPTGAGTRLGELMETRLIDGREMVLASPIRGDVSPVRAWKADTAGNLQYRMTESNFNQVAATAAKLVIAEVEDIVPVGGLDPNTVHTPGGFVDYLVKAHVRRQGLGSSGSVSLSLKRVDDSQMNMARALWLSSNLATSSISGSEFPPWSPIPSARTTESSCLPRTACLALGPNPSQAGRWTTLLMPARSQ